MASDDPLAKTVIERWEKADKALKEARRNYWLNTCFYQGRQWLTWDDARHIVNDLPTVERDTERVRLTINKIKPRVNGLLGRLTQRILQFEVPASDVDDSSLYGSELASSVLEHVHREQHWEAARLDTLFNILMGGTAAVALDWDGTAGDELWTGEHGEIVGTGDVTLIPLSIAEFSVQPHVRRWQDAIWWIAAMAVPPEQAKDRYNLDFTPQADASSAYGPTHRRLFTTGTTGDVDLTSVYVMYERPNKSTPKGRRVVVINNKAVVDDPWPFKFNDLNLRVFYQTPIPGQWVGDTFLNDARKIQVAYNHVQSCVAEHAKLAGNARLLVPQGALADEQALTDEAGEILPYYNDGTGAKPEWMTPAPLQRWLTNWASELETMLDDVMHTHQVTRGMAPGDRNSGLALSILAEKDDTPLGVMSHDQALGWGQLASMVLRLYAENVTERRHAKVDVGDGMPRDFEWDGRLLGSQTTVRVPLENTLPTSRVAMIAQLTQMAGSFPQLAQALDASSIVRLTGVTALEDINDVVDTHAAKAQSENAQMTAGRVVFPERWHDHGKHIAEHNQLRNAKVFESFDQMQRDMIDAHIRAHQRLAEEEAKAQAAINAVVPGLAALPQANEPMGSAVPAPFQERSAQPGAA